MSSKKRIYLIDKSSISSDDLNIIQLRHPATNRPASFAKCGDKLMEVMKYSEQYRSWFF